MIPIGVITTQYLYELLILAVVTVFLGATLLYYYKQKTVMDDMIRKAIESKEKRISLGRKELKSERKKLKKEKNELKVQKFSEFKKMIKNFSSSISHMSSGGFSETVDKIDKLTNNEFSNQLRLLKQGFNTNVESEIISFNSQELEMLDYPDNEQQFQNFKAKFSRLINQYELYINEIETTIKSKNLEIPSIQHLIYNNLKLVSKMKKEELRKFY